MAVAYDIFNPGAGPVTGVADEVITRGLCLKLVAVTGTEDFRLGIADTAASDIIVGVSVNDDAAASGDVFAWQPNGVIGKVIAGGSVTLGAVLTCESGGNAVVTTTTGDYLLGTALNAAADGELVYYISGGHRRYAATS